MKKIIVLVIAAIASLIGYLQNNPQLISSFTSESTLSSAPAASVDNAALKQAILQKQRDVQVEGTGVVVHLLPDDNKGSRHQRFLLEVLPGKTVLVAHNIDLAPRINNLRKGDHVSFYGEYIWNEKGGVVHWTHHAPRKNHVDGWIKHHGEIYK